MHLPRDATLNESNVMIQMLKIGIIEIDLFISSGAYGSSQIPYVFGYPFMNETVLNETELVMKQWYDYEDRNMSDCTMQIWTNFIKYTWVFIIN